MARGINKVILIGNLGQDPEVKYMPNGGAVANVTIATSESWKDKNTGETQEKTEWHRVVFFRRLAEIVGEYLKKGSKVYLEGSLRRVATTATPPKSSPTKCRCSTAAVAEGETLNPHRVPRPKNNRPLHRQVVMMILMMIFRFKDS